MDIGCYRVYGLLLASNRSLDELLPSAIGRPDLSVHFGEPGAAHRHEWFHRWPIVANDPGSADWLQICETPTGFLLRFPDLADFVLNVSDKSITCTPVRTLPPATLNHLLLDQVLPLVLAETGRCVVHASAVAFNVGQAIAFAAPTGFGKSTLAAALAKSGGRLLTDDGLLVQHRAEGEIECVASYPGVRLWKESSTQLFGSAAEVEQYAHYTPKQRIALEENAIEVHDGPARLARLYFIGSPEKAKEISIAPLTAREAFLELVKFSFVLDVRNRDRQRANFARFSQLASTAIFFGLNYPRTWEALPEVVDAVRAHAVVG